MALKKSLPAEYIPRTASQARSWVGELPLTDLGQTTRRLYTGLIDLNQSRVAPSARIEVSEIIRPVTELVLGNLRRHLISRAFPLPKKSQKIFELNQALLLELAGSYQLAALDMLTTSTITRKQLLKAIFRSMDYMARVLVQSYTVYTKTRETVWHDIHHLYLLACENGLDEVVVSKSEKHFSCIADIYKYINILALSMPYSLRQGEIERLDYFYRNHLSLIAITNNSDTLEGELAHVAFLNNDDPPAIVPIQDVLNSPTVRMFDLKALLGYLQNALQQHEHTEPTPQERLSPSLIKRLMNHLTQVRNRQFNRYPIKQTMKVVSGLGNIVRLLQEVPRVEQSNDPSEEDYIFSALNYQGEIESNQPLSSDTSVPNQVWQAENSSTGGYGLCWQQNMPSGARVGEIVALRSDENPLADWQAGTIRWLEFVKNKGLCMGIELMVPKILPTEVRHINNRKASQQLPIVGAVLPIIEGIRPHPELIFPEQVFKLGDELHLELFQQEENIRLTSCDETSGTYDIFSYQVLEKKSTMDEEESEEFSSIWESL